MRRGRISSRQTVRRAKIPLHYVYELLWSDVLTGEKVDGVWQIDVASVEALIEKRRKRAAAVHSRKQQGTREEPVQLSA